MSLPQIRRKCRHCREFFIPDYRHRFTQFYCSKPDCRRACKATLQHRWLRKGKNRDYFRGDKAVQRVRDWRQSHPGYWKIKTPVSQSTQVIEPQVVKPQHESCNVPTTPPGTLKDFCLAQDPAFIGLLSMITGSTLQDEIAVTARQVLIQGRNIMGLAKPGPSQSKTEWNHYDSQTDSPAGPVAADSHQL
jgi:hypothetical protein